MRGIVFALLALSLVATANGRSWSDEVIYFALTDRFRDGDLSNNLPAGSDPALYDVAQRDINRYHGGDLRGLELAVRDGYFEALGMTALWITPPVRNTWRSGYDLGGWKTGYHGYWAQDFLDIDPHLTSRKALDGSEYPDTADGRMRHYRDFVALARAHGMRVIQDVVLNHTGPVFYYDANGNHAFDRGDKNEWVQPFLRDGFHDNARWADVPEWNLRRTMPDGPRELLGRTVPTTGVLSRLETYGRKGFNWDSLGKHDGEEVICDFFALRDLWTAPGSAHFDALVNEFVEIYAFYLLDVGVDGLRIDTVKHVHHEFWDAFTRRLRQRLGDKAPDKILFGEIYDGDPAVLGRYTWRTDWQADKSPCLDSVLDFRFCFAAREYLRHGGDASGSPRALEQALCERTANGPDGRPFYNPNPGPDGLNARQKVVTFIENHDGLNRFLVDHVTARRNTLAQALVLTCPGIPCLYYGTEVPLADGDGKLGQDGETGRLTLFRQAGGPTMSEASNGPAFRAVAAMAKLRRELPALRDGTFVPLWCDNPDATSDDGVFAFARVMRRGGAPDPATTVVVAMNASGAARVTAAGENRMRLMDAGGKLLFGNATRLEVLHPLAADAAPTRVMVPGDGGLALEVPAGELVIVKAAAE